MEVGFAGNMAGFWLTAYLTAAVLAIAQAVLLAVQTWEHRRYGRSRMRGLGRDRPRGRAMLVAPCKGLDVELEDNLQALFEQDYDDYEIAFVVESEQDPACQVIRRVMAAHSRVPARLLAAGKAVDCGQKVHNLLAATAQIPAGIEYLAFVDSDARPRPEWLRALIAPLEAPGVGAVTGYRWFIPERPSLANHLLSTMNCDVMALLGRSSHYLVWGGSWAIRRQAFEAIGLRDAWRGTLSDDLVASRVLRRARLGVRFEPACVIASPADFSMGQMLAFARRQYLTGRCYVPDWWAFALAATTFATAAWVANLVVAGWGLVHGGPLPWIAAATCAILYGLSVFRAKVCQDLIETYFPERAAQLRGARRVHVWAGPSVGFARWLCVFGSAFGRHISWRGIRYRMLPGGQARIVARQDEPAVVPIRPESENAGPTTAMSPPLPWRKAG